MTYLYDTIDCAQDGSAVYAAIELRSYLERSWARHLNEAIISLMLAQSCDIAILTVCIVDMRSMLQREWPATHTYNDLSLYFTHPSLSTNTKPLTCHYINRILKLIDQILQREG